MSDSPLFVPQSDYSHEIEGIAVFLTHEEIFASPGSYEMLRELLTDLPVEGALLSLAKLLAVMSNVNTELGEAQQAMVRELLESPARERALSYLRKEPDRRAFFEEQILALAKQAILLCKRDARRDLSHEEAQKLFRALFVVADLLSLEHEATGDDFTDVMLMSLRSLYFNQKEPARHLLTRYFDLFLRRPALQKHAISSNHVDFNTAFREERGVDLEDFIAAGAVLFAHVSRFKRPADLGQTRFDVPWDGFGLHLSSTNSEAAFVTQISRPLDAFRSAFEGQKVTSSVLGSTLLPFFQTPVLNSLNSSLVVLSQRLLVESITEGMYWVLHEHFRKRGRAALLRYTSFVGELFEGQLLDLLEGIYPDSEPLTRRLFGEIPYGSRQGMLSSDATIVYGDSLVFLEAYTGRLRYQDTVLQGGLQAFYEDIEKCIIKKASQLERVIGDFQAGDLTIPGIDRGQVRHIYPAIVLLEPFPEYPTVWIRINERLDAEGFFKSSEPLQLLSMEAMELLEPLLKEGRTLVDLLAQKTADGFYKHSSMKNYLLAQRLYPDLLDKRVESIWDQFKSMVHRRVAERPATDEPDMAGLL